MRLLADENFPPTLLSALQKKRHNVKRIQRTDKGISDEQVREKAFRENRIIITFDRDLLEKEKQGIGVSVMLFVFPLLAPQEILPYLDSTIKKMGKLKQKKKPFKAISSEMGIEVL